MASATDVAAPPTPPTGTTNPAARVLIERLGASVRKVDDWRGDLAITVDRQAWVQACTLLRDHPDLDFKLFLDLCGVDYLDEREDRFEVVFHAYSVSQKHHVRVKATLPESDPTIDTLDRVYKGANWFEREAWDLYGIKFKGHPNLTRILTHKDFVGHGMRKDYPTAKRHILKEPEPWLLQVPKDTEQVVVNIGPSHPAMHGCFRVQAVMDGEIIPVDVYVPGCPPAPEALIAAVMKIQERIKQGVQAKSPQRARNLGAPGEGAIDRRNRRAVWAREDAERAAQGLPPRGVLPL
ncbi:MAG TPA: NADH-quinone oxidoreductase subunit C, partial [Myxococcales bacterium]|nr:NADH-quinone oxidoreductase subunit C [Myxococcales bacterium]